MIVHNVKKCKISAKVFHSKKSRYGRGLKAFFTKSCYLLLLLNNFII